MRVRRRSLRLRSERSVFVGGDSVFVAGDCAFVGAR
jgi:hypothetical protein